MVNITAAGGIVFRKKNNVIEIALIKDPYGKYAFPKGHIKKGENIKQAALRETEEEMGCKNIEIIKEIGKIHYLFKDELKRYNNKKELVKKTVYYYLMEISSDEKCFPQREEGIEEVLWVSMDSVREKIGYENIRSILEKSLKSIILNNKL